MLPNPFVWVKRRPKELFIESYSNATRTLQIRGFTSNEQIITDHTTNSDRSLATTTVPITSIPIHLTANLSVASVSRGECYVRVSLRVEGVVVALLGAGYVSDTGTIAFPGGKIESSVEGPGNIRHVSFVNPSQGLDMTLVVPARVRWRLISWHALLLTGVTVADRLVTFFIQRDLKDVLITSSPHITTASQTSRFTAAAFGTLSQDIPESRQIPIPAQFFLSGGDLIKTFTINLQAGDDWAIPRILVEEWIEP